MLISNFKIRKKILIKEGVYLLILLFFIFLSAQALFRDGFFRTIDDITTVRIIYMVKELQRGNWINNFPIRWSADLAHGFGYPLYLFYGPMVYYVGGFLMIFLHLSHIVATKWVYVFPLIVGPIFFYLAARQKFSSLVSLMSSVTYTLFPFRGYDTYIRGGVGEAWAMAFLPMIFFGIFLIEKKEYSGNIITALFIALTILSHNISGLLILSLIVIYGITFHRLNFRFWKSILLGLGLSAFFWLPAYFYLSIVKVTYSNQNTDQILNFLEPFSSLFKIEIPYNPEARFSSLIIYFFLSIGLLIFWRYKKFQTENRRYVFFWYFLGLILFLILFQPFAFFWQWTLPITRLLQFPWRMLILLSFIFPLILAYVIAPLKNSTMFKFLIVILIIANLYYLPVFKPREYSYFFEYSAADTGICATSWGDEYLPVWVKLCAGGQPSEKIAIKQGDVKMTKSDNMDLHADVSVRGKGEMLIYNYYFPGWQVIVDNKRQPVAYRFSEQGIFKTDIKPGRHQVRIFYSKTWIMWIADITSLLSLLYLLWMIWVRRSTKMKILR